MKRRFLSVVGLVLFLIFLVSCNPTSGGPSAWIDRPLDNTNHPVAPLIIQAHASDTNGIASFEFVVDDTSLTSITADGSRLSEAIFEWTPSAPGTYTVMVRATNSGGDVGPFATSRVTIGGPVTPTQDALQLLDTPTTAAQSADNTPTFAEIAGIECTEGLTVNVDIRISHPQGIVSYKIFSTWVAAEVEESFAESLPQSIEKRVQLTEPFADDIDRAHEVGLMVVLPDQSDPIYAYATEPNNRCEGHYQPPVVVEPDQPTAPLVTARTNANCRSGPGTGYDIITSLSEGQSAAIEGRNANSSWWVIDPGLGGKTCWIAASTVDVSGEVSGVAIIAPPPLPVTDTPTPTLEPTVTLTPSPTIELITDTTPPSFFSTGVSPDSILTDGGGCPSYERTTTVAAAVADESGLSSVVAYWYIGGENGQAAMQEGSMGHWASIGPVNTTGTMEIYIVAQDTFGNIAQSDLLYVTVQDCIE